jgi:hypothetical protein
MKEVSVIVREEEVMGSNLSPFTYLRLKFKVEHNLDFTVEQFERGDDFKFQEATDGTAYKVTWLGGEK